MHPFKSIFSFLRDGRRPHKPRRLTPAHRRLRSRGGSTAAPSVVAAPASPESVTEDAGIGHACHLVRHVLAAAIGNSQRRLDFGTIFPERVMVNKLVLAGDSAIIADRPHRSRDPCSGPSKESYFLQLFQRAQFISSGVAKISEV
jgi:hypothetical protein